MSQPQTIKLGKTEYVIIPKAEYLRLQGMGGYLRVLSTPRSTPEHRSVRR
jgi:hypothetical protein